MDLGERESEGRTRKNGGGETAVGMYCVKRRLNFKKEEKEKGNYEPQVENLRLKPST